MARALHCGRYIAGATLVSEVGSTMDATLLRMSQRPPPRFSAGTDLVLWLSRFELYVRLAKIPQDQVTGELLSLLDDGPFRVVSQQGLINSSYDSVVKCLRALYAPEVRVTNSSGSANYKIECRNRGNSWWSLLESCEYLLTEPIPDGPLNIDRKH